MLEHYYRNDWLVMRLEPVRPASPLNCRINGKDAGIVSKLMGSIVARATRNVSRNSMLPDHRATHSERVAEYAVRLGRAMDIDPERITFLHRGGLLHDIGKIGTPDTILRKDKPLSADEFEEVKAHPEIGAKLLEPIEKNIDILSVVLQHHERYDGTGYPYGLAGAQINLLGRITALADVYDALSSVRPYRDQWDKGRVVDYIIDHAGSHFDPAVVEVFQSIADEIPELPRFAAAPATT